MNCNFRGYANGHDSFGLVYYNFFAQMNLKTAQKRNKISNRPRVSAYVTSTSRMYYNLGPTKFIYRSRDSYLGSARLNQVTCAYFSLTLLS
jgi:hypothetical protein